MHVRVAIGATLANGGNPRAARYSGGLATRRPTQRRLEVRLVASSTKALRSSFG